MSDRPLDIEPHLPAANVSHIAKLYETGEIITLDGEILPVSDADSDSLVAWMIAAKRMRDIARRMEDMAGGEMLARVRETAGPIQTEFGTAKESISRGSISGTTAERIRAILEEAAEDGAIPWEAVDNVAPMKPHITPARLADYAETVKQSNTLLADAIEQLLPERRRVVKVDEKTA